MAATEIVTVQHERASAPRQERISRAVKRAIDHMVFEGLKRDKAAEKAGIADHTLYTSLRKPGVLAYLNAQQQVLRTSASARSIARIDNLADDAVSEHVKLQSNVFLLGIDGISPTQRIENTHLHLNQQPGLTINFMLGEPARQIDGLAHQVEDARIINGLPQSIPHPSMRNAVIGPAKTDGQPAILEGPAAGTRGAKT